MASVGRIYDITLHDPVEEDEQALANMHVLEQNTYRYKKDEKAYYFTKEDLLAHPPLISTNTMEQYAPDNQPELVTEPLPEQVYIMDNDPDEARKLAAVPDEWSQAISREFISSYEMLSGRAVQIVDQETYAAIKGSEHKVLVAQVDDYLKYKADLKAMDERQMKSEKAEEKQKVLLHHEEDFFDG
ncbi:hypothetical protein [Brevibacillus sp. SAFN-007a]|uniref:hypothetical protein n=1 Tax=Brevibacillus sp. SAFN-007a TaxID=3436862 RepID=UPI003F7E1406